MPFRNNISRDNPLYDFNVAISLINCSNVINITCFERRNFLTSHKTDFFLLDSKSNLYLI